MPSESPRMDGAPQPAQTGARFNGYDEDLHGPFMKNHSMSPSDLVELLEKTAYNLYLAALLNPCDEAHTSLFRRMKDPQPGDVVVEWSTLGFKRGDGTRCGVLLRKERGPTHTLEDWKAMGGGDEEIPTQLVWVIRLDFDDGREFRWSNAAFIAIPTEVWNWWPEPATATASPAPRSPAAPAAFRSSAPAPAALAPESGAHTAPPDSPRSAR
jgi:hypothetical protein